MIDYHTHSIYSDGKSTYLDLLQEANRKGIVELGFSDHLCLNYPEWALKKEDFERVKQEIIQLKKETELVNIRFGLEVDYLEGKELEIKEQLSQFPLDYVIGSIHYVNGWNFDTSTERYSRLDINKFYSDYSDLLNKAASSRLFDIIGHADVVKKFNFKPSFCLDDYYEKSAKVFRNANVVIELNTSGKDKPCNEFYPSDKFLEFCFLNNVSVTLGSDAHLATDLARYYSEAIQKLISIGYRRIAVFKKRKRSFLNL